MQYSKVVRILLRISIASVFLYAAAAATLEPYNWIGYIPVFIQKMVSASVLLPLFSLYQLLLSIWILTGWKTKYAASLASLTLLAIIVANFSQLDILFRDFAIFFAAIALVMSDVGRKNTTR